LPKSCQNSSQIDTYVYAVVLLPVPLNYGFYTCNFWLNILMHLSTPRAVEQQILP